MERTLTIIKPKAVKNGHIGAILDMIKRHDFNILGLKKLRLTKIQSGEFYAVHKGRPFYDELVDFMANDEVVVAVLEKENAVADYRKLIGNTNPKEADKDTIRGIYGTDIQSNAVHGSDSVENGIKETSFFFAEIELI